MGNQYEERLRQRSLDMIDELEGLQEHIEAEYQKQLSSRPAVSVEVLHAKERIVKAKKVQGVFYREVCELIKLKENSDGK